MIIGERVPLSLEVCPARWRHGVFFSFSTEVAFMECQPFVQNV